MESELRERLLKLPRMKSFEERWKINAPVKVNPDPPPPPRDIGGD